MKFNRQFYKTSSFYFGWALVLAPLVNLAVSQDPVGKWPQYSKPLCLKRPWLAWLRS